jgi:carboxymethylenebutenolidase
MNEYVSLTAADGHKLSAYVAHPEGEPRGALVVVQEIFGVNPHIRRVTDAFAADGFLAVAPALFDRYEPGVELGYEGADMEKARSFIPRLDFGKALQDVAAAMEYASRSGLKVGVVGYCFGGTLAWVAAAQLKPAAVVGYYGGRIGNFAAEQPSCPVMLHFGRGDTHIPAEEVNKITSAHHEVEVYWYDAGHGFNCDARSAFEPKSAAEARKRTVEFFSKNLQ